MTAVPTRAARPSLPGAEPGRPACGAPESQCALMMDAIDYGAVLLDVEGRLVHCNRIARSRLQAGQAVSLGDEGLLYQRQVDRTRLEAAIQGAARRGHRELIEVGEPGESIEIAVIPMEREAGAPMSALLLLSRARLCEPLSIDFYARGRGLSNAERRVLDALCAGVRPADIATRLGVRINTIRTHVGRIRAKTGTASIDDLLLQVARLPPVLNVLQC